MSQVYKVSLVLAPQPESGFTVTSPVLPELITEVDTLDEALVAALQRRSVRERANRPEVDSGIALLKRRI